MDMTDTTVDIGTGYGHKTPSHDARLTEVGPGTPMGEAMRRYWHPIASSATLTPNLPHRRRVLGEDLIVFRDGQGRPGVVFERCAHRGSSLYYGRIEDDGIRCCYHGWKFDVRGRCLDQPAEPEGGRQRDRVCQPWYPVEERYGLVFVYMGPPDRKPALPRYDCLEPLEEGQQYYATWPVPGAEVTGMVQDWNWLQTFENAMDAPHAIWLHSNHSGYQFEGTGTTGFPEDFYDPAAFPGSSTYAKTEFGVRNDVRFRAKAENGVRPERVVTVEVHLPNVLGLFDWVQMDSPQDVAVLWFVPTDDTHLQPMFSCRTSDPERVNRFLFGIKQNGKLPWEMTEEERQRFPGDFEAQGSQGPITLHSEENLTSGDRGIVMLRQRLKTMVADVEAGRDPVGVSMVDGPPRHIATGVSTVSATAEKAAAALSPAGP
jgi:phenylpropionate dioxygenase-like ring-hydroxylating dioxygenase large terminal subunit